jgi:hypothetical protein
MRKEVVKLSLLSNDLILYLKDLEELHQKSPKHHKQFPQSCRIENLSTKTNSLSVHQQ